MNTFKLEGPGGIPGLKLSKGFTVQTDSNWQFNGSVALNGTGNSFTAGAYTVSNSGVAVQGANAGIDSAFANTLRIYNNFASGNTQIVTPNGSTQFYAGGNNVLNVLSTGAALQPGVATAAGGALAATMGSVNLGVYWGSGAPTVSAPQGSLYLRTDGSSTSTRAYINTNGTTGWAAITTAS